MKLKWVVFVYFLVAGLLNGYLFCTLWLTQPRTEQKQESTSETAKQAASANGKDQTSAPSSNASATTAPAASESQPACTTTVGDPPAITRLDPDEVAIGENYTSVAIYGCHFRPDDKLKQPREVSFNGTKRDSTVVDDNEIVAQLHASDFAAPETIMVDVETLAASATSQTVPSQTPTSGGSVAPTTVKSNIKALQIKSSSSILVTWYPWRSRRVDITLETRLILLILFTGAFGGCITGLKSFVDYAGDCKLRPSWFPFYFAGPFLGAGVAFAFYVVIRGGILAGTNIDIKAVNPFGMVAVAVLVGMFSDAAIRKLNEVFDNLFKPPKDTRGGTLLDLGICPDVLPDGVVGMNYRQVIFQASGGTTPYTWSQVGLPDGLSLSPDGVLSGKPNAPFTGTVKIQVTDSANPKNTGSRSIPLTIKAPNQQQQNQQQQNEQG